jgi:hypothetical protein
MWWTIGLTIWGTAAAVPLSWCMIAGISDRRAPKPSIKIPARWNAA